MPQAAILNTGRIHEVLAKLVAFASRLLKTYDGRIILHVAFWVFMIKWMLFQSSWMVGDNQPEAMALLSFYRYLLVIACFYTLSFLIALPYSSIRVLTISILALVFFLIMYCLMMYAVCDYIVRLYPHVPTYFYNIFRNVSEKGPWTFIHSPFTLYFNFEQFGLALLPALAVKIFRLNLQIRLKSIKLEKSNMELELNSLRSQINPHFLFNTLNSLYSLIEEKDAVAASIIASLSVMMRYALYESNAMQVDVVQELEFIREYLEIQNIRHSNRLNLSVELSSGIDHQKIPPLILITFLENAVKHGLHKVDKTKIEIKAYLENEKFCFFVANSKPAKTKLMEKEGIGIKNTKRRLDILYPDRHSLTIAETAGEFQILLKIW